MPLVSVLPSDSSYCVGASSGNTRFSMYCFKAGGRPSYSLPGFPLVSKARSKIAILRGFCGASSNVIIVNKWITGIFQNILVLRQCIFYQYYRHGFEKVATSR